MVQFDLNKLTTQEVIRLNEISRDTRVDFNNLIKNIIESTDKSLVWLLQPLVSRNMYLSNFFIEICQMLLTIEILDSNTDLKIIIVKTNEQKKILKKYLNGSKSLSIKVNNKSKNNNFKSTNFYKILKIIYKTVKMIGSKSQERQNKINRKDSITLIDTFLTKNGLTKGENIDRYYPGLLNHITKEKASLIYWLPTILGKYNTKQIKKLNKNSSLKFIFKQDFLTLKDYMWSFYQMIKARSPVSHKLNIGGLYIDPLILREFKSGKLNSSVYDGLLNYRFIRKLSEASIKLKLVIDWNENQPIDKGLIKGVKDYYPYTITKGYQGYIISLDYNFYISPTDYEIECGVIPHEICVVGNNFKNLITQFSKNINVTTAPAFRFNYLLSKKVKNINHEENDSKKNILILLPIGRKEINVILKKLYYTFSELINKINFNILVKPHPLVDQKIIINSEYFRSEYTIVEENFSDIIDDVDLLIGNSSSALVESIFNCIPVIIIGSMDHITQNPIPSLLMPKLWKVIYDTETINETIIEFLSLAKDDKNDIRYELENKKREYIEAVNKKTVKNFLNL